MDQQERDGHFDAFSNNVTPVVGVHSTGLEKPRLQKLSEARRRQGLSVRCVAQRLGRTVSEVRAQENENADLLISELYRWQQALEVPVEELLEDPNDELSSSVLTRARMLKVMKTVMAIRRQARSESERRLVRLLIEQLLEIMPELKEVSAWPAVGHRRRAEEMGRIAENPISDDWLHEAS
jgi:transcriptional regulator with XRE-family HTH domain